MDVIASLPRRRETVDCFNCSASRRPCDRSRHRCNTCSQTSEICEGYPRELQWLSGVTSRGKQKGRSLSIKPSSQVWESTTPTNHTFIFKPEKPQRIRKQTPHSPKTRSAQKAVTRQSHRGSGTGIGHSNGLCASESEAYLAPVESPSHGAGSSPAHLCHSGPFEDVFDDLDSSLMNQFSSSDDGMFLLPLSPDSLWQSDAGEAHVVESESSMMTPTSISSLPNMAPSQLLTFYDTDLCALPLTFDFPANPFRCKAERAPHLVHAVIAISIQHISRMSDSSQEDVLSHQVMTYRKSASELCTAALQAIPKQSKRAVLDGILVLFALDTLISSAGPWNARLIDAYHKIESIGGVDAVASSTYSQAQLSMFVWWDCIISLLSRSNPVLPQSYFDVAMTYNDGPSWDIHVLSGVPKELFQYFREIIQLASEKEQISQMKYAKFDTTRVYELEQAIQGYTVAPFKAQDSLEDTTQDDEMIHTWHDYCNASNAWKYALLLYLARVLKWDRTSGPRLPEATSLARLVLDSVRSCRPESSLRKQLLFPLFLAGSEAMDSYSRKFVKEYCEEWYQNSRYSMFMEALGLLQDIWAHKDVKEDDSSIWWGGVIGSKQLHGSGILLG